MINRLFSVGLLIATLLVSGCATYTTKVQKVYNHLGQQQPALALAELDKNPGPVRDRLAYLLNRAILLRMIGDYTASNGVLEESKALIDKLEALSLREQAGAVAINDAMRSYEGMPHEHVLVHLYSALNYLQLGELDSARVEALQVNLRLQHIAEGSDDKSATRYNEDPFARYLTGLIYDTLGEWSDAMIAYRNAYEDYKRYSKTLQIDTPEFLKYDLIRLSDKMGLKDEHNKYQKEFGIKEFVTVKQFQQLGELVVILHNGLAPKKKESVGREVAPTTGRIVSIALPYYVSTNRHARLARVHIDGITKASQTVANIDAIAKQTLANQMPAITTRAFARAILKDSMARNTEDQAGALAGLMVNIASAVTEVADTRSWWTLPHDIQMIRIPIEPGNYNIKIDLLGPNNIVFQTIDINDVEIKKGKRTFVEKHWLNSLGTDQEQRGRRRNG